MAFPSGKIIERINWRLILPAMALSLMGLLSILSMSLASKNFLYFGKQLIFFVFSLGVAIVLSVLDLRFLKINSHFVFFLYFFSLAALAGLFPLGVESRGVRGWYRLGPFSFSPVPFSAIILIIVLSKYFSTRHIEVGRFQPIFFSGFYFLIPFALILLQPDFGSALALFFVWFGTINFSGIKIRHLFILMLVFSLLAVLAWQFWLKDYQKQRILAFLKPEIDAKGISWNVAQSKIAIGSGGLLGKGLGKGTQVHYGFLPEAKTDFIFSAWAEETGFVGVLFLLFFIGLLFFSSLKIVFYTNDNFTKLFAAGFSFLFFAQSFINMAMAFGFLPVVGIPLPFVSYGGSHLLAFYLGLGILASLERRTPVS